ncbi:MAG: PTS sugar transporter subunit IIA, partial [Selenomonadaceae bacterium]|nr:PTS sugar transporter subunit IIA [Selenomonadaceae bacterium]
STTRIFAQNVDRFFRRECFITDKTFKTKERILDFMTGELEKLGLMDKEASDSVKEREIASPTEIGNLVAIPHPLKNSAAISSISVLVLERPILWVEHQVQVIFLLSIATSEFYLWEPIFLKLFKYLVKENGVRRLLNNPDYDAFIKDFKQSFSTKSKLTCANVCAKVIVSNIQTARGSASQFAFDYSIRFREQGQVFLRRRFFYERRAKSCRIVR